MAARTYFTVILLQVVFNFPTFNAYFESHLKNAFVEEVPDEKSRLSCKIENCSWEKLDLVSWKRRRN